METKELAEHFVKIWTEDKIEYIEKIMSPEVNLTFNASISQGREFFKQRVFFQKTLFKDAHYTISEIISTHDRAIIRWHGKVVYVGSYEEMKPTNKPLEYSGVTVLAIKNEKISDIWVYSNLLDILHEQQEK